MNATLRPVAAALSSLARWISRAEIEWRWRLSDSRPRVYFANHTSHLDALLVLSAFPPAIRELTRPVACRDYWGATRLRSYLADRVFGSVLISRSKDTPFAVRATLSALARELEGGRSLILFPEGTRGTKGRIAEFRGGLYELCRERVGLEAAPVYLENAHPALGSRGRIVFGPPLRLSTGESRPDFLRRARNALQELAAQ